MSLKSLFWLNPCLNYLRNRPNSTATKFLRAAYGTIQRELLNPPLAPYLPPEYEERWGPSRRPILDPLFYLYRRRRDRISFKSHLRSSDVFLVGHPKSGNTWLAYMLATLIFKDTDNEIHLNNVGDYVPVIHGKDNRIGQYSHLPEPRVFRNEWTVYADLYPKSVYLVRDPRATLVSYYHMYRTISADANTTMEAFVKEYLSQGQIIRLEPLVRWDRQVSAWMRRARHDGRVLIVKYEDMVRDRLGVLKRVLHFARIPCTKDDLELASARGEFHAMQKDEREHGAESYPGEIGQRGRFIRRGKVDSWKDEMTASLVEHIEKELGQTMKAIGYPL